MFPYYKSWINFHFWNNFSWMIFISSSKLMKFFPLKFIHWKFTNDISWKSFAQLFCWVHLDISLFQLAKLWSPGSYLAILPHWMYLFARCTLPNNSGQLSSPCCLVSIRKLLTLRHQDEIAKLPSPNSLCGLLSSCPKKLKFLGWTMPEFFPFH
jgi:hypothetical protein